MSTAALSFPRSAIEACLDRIAASPHFSRSRKLVRFLRFTVEAILDDRGGELKERTIGVDVYGRARDYDCRTDPIVRSEAHRLRTRLAAYYAREGAADPIVIELPKGSYVPELHPNKAEPGRGLAGCRVIVAAFEDRSPDDRDAARAGALTRALRTRLEGWPGLRVLPESSGAEGSRDADTHLAADYRLDGSLVRHHGRCEVAVRLVRLADEKEIWSDVQPFARTRRDEPMPPLAEPLAASIGAVLTRRQDHHKGAVNARAHDLFVKGRHSSIEYGNSLDPRHLEAAQRRLRAALEDDPDYVDALAELAHLELMSLYPPRRSAEDILARARSLLERALAVEPRHARSLYLLGHVEGSALRPRTALQLTESAVAVDPDDPEGRTMLAVRFASLGFWESAVMACDWALALDPVWDAPRRIKAYWLTRMGRLDATRLVIEEMVQRATSPIEIAMARFDLRIAEGDLAGARTALESLDSTFPRRPDQEDRREIATALANALEGRQGNARRKLAAHRGGGPRFWDHTIRLALALGDEDRARKLLLGNPINQSYRWLATEPLVRPHLHRRPWRALARDLHASWLRDVEEVSPRLPAPSPPLPAPGDLDA